jgi:hypothetical protein
MSSASACLKCLGLCAFSVAAIAQENPMPVGEMGVQWAYNNLETSQTGGWSNQNGGSIYGQYFFKRSVRHWHGRAMFGIAGEFSRSGSQSGSLYSYLFGPRFSTEWRKQHLALHGEYKIGGDRVRVNGVTPAGGQVTAVRNSFAWGAASVGLDAVVARRYVVNLLQVDFLNLDVPQFPGGGSWREDLRVSAGIGFRFGER